MITGGRLVGLVLAVGLIAAASPAGAAHAAAATTRTRTDAAAIVALARDAMAKHDLRAVILRVTVDGRNVVTRALGESMTGVPATTRMHFRNGAVAISYMSTVLLQLVDEKRVSLDDTVSKWLPGLPQADQVTLRMLANMTAGYPDYVPDEGFLSAVYANPFRAWTPEELIDIGLSRPRLFEPGTNWDYSHTNYVILGQVLERITGQPLVTLVRDRILRPLDLRNTRSAATGAIPRPALHAYSSERRESLGIDPSVRFYEESTFWNPSWTLAEGAVQTTDIRDMAATAVAVGEGALLSRAAHRAQVGPSLLGFGAPLEGCRACHTLDETYNYGLGVVLSGPWILQNPLFGGYGAVEAYLPSKRIAIAVVTTFGEGSFDEHGNVANRAMDVFKAIGAYLAPDEPPPTNA